MTDPPIYGCSGCGGTSGRSGCPTHGSSFVTPFVGPCFACATKDAKIAALEETLQSAIQACGDYYAPPDDLIGAIRNIRQVVLSEQENAVALEAEVERLKFCLNCHHLSLMRQEAIIRAEQAEEEVERLKEFSELQERDAEMSLAPFVALATPLEDAIFEHEQRHHYALTGCKEAECGWPIKGRNALTHPAVQRAIQKLGRRIGPDEVALGRIVEAGGGRYVGLQPCLGRAEPLVLFDDPLTLTTLSVPLSCCSVEAVKGRIAESRGTT